MYDVKGGDAGDAGTSCLAAISVDFGDDEDDILVKMEMAKKNSTNTTAPLRNKYSCDVEAEDKMDIEELQKIQNVKK